MMKYIQELKTIQDKIKNMNPIYNTSVDKYIVYLEECVVVIDGEKVNSVEVITIPHTKNILTIYPVKTIGKEKGEKTFIKNYGC